VGIEHALTKARETLASGALTNEAQVRSAVIAPLLNALGWDPADPSQWLVEYAVGTGNVDDALFGPNGSALVFVEAKKQGNLSVKAEDQLFGYANNKGVPLLVLTDGNVWDLYLSMAAGEPTERRFCHHEIKESRDLAAMAADMDRYLSREEVVRGKAKSNAEKRLADILNRERGRKALPVAWNALLSEPDELLRDLLIESAEQATGSRPWREDAETFLRQSSADPGTSILYGDVLAWLRAAPADVTSGMKSAVTKWRKQLDGPVSKKPSRDGPAPKPIHRSGKLRGIRIQGTEHEATVYKRVHLLLASELQNLNGGLLGELAALARPGMKNPRAVKASDPILQSERAKYYQEVPKQPGWYLHVHQSAEDHRRLMREMTELAGLQWGSDVALLVED